VHDSGRAPRTALATAGPDSAMHSANESLQCSVSVCVRAIELAPTVDGMLPDLRFALGATLAMTVLGVTSLGIVMSVQLVHEARDGSFEASRSLAFADTGGARNPFYDPAPRPFPVVNDAPEEAAADATAPSAAEGSSDDPPSLSDPPPVEAARVAAIDPPEAAVEPTKAGATAAPPAAEPAPAEPDRVASVPPTVSPSEPREDTHHELSLTGKVPLPPIPPKSVPRSEPGAGVPARAPHRRLVVHRAPAKATTTTAQQPFSYQQPFSSQGYWTDTGQWQAYPVQQSGTAGAATTRTRVTGTQTSTTATPARH
jgi:hypothetical protein